ncbi:hypothetical protein K493DRAFT_293676 [Basidiobolus meristosporus CBS 931.73]|uniref:L-ornithine N(5)-monooxygenase [NAD(P)H] n=1 Tax=Basidiobolus meristosporus CBS 931.73 TaxID=1314790 RepID=A0A1Y1WY16_9FUNG|nr:hypothetical protein K493DRAFT_293676 [Basidiobolus meristosporus CBS 931.73]|eukprot:ORX77994.1 hypothetical protein K493DRAFT_293676 [Basidiobolus meristosporus CBS 931.73]
MEYDHQEYDILCAGFGPAGVSIAIAMAEDGRLQGFEEHSKGINQGGHWKVGFIEKQTTPVWHGGMLIDEAKMQISFLKDLATLNNPKSHFTFINYLKENNRLVDFTNLGTTLPYRSEFNDYVNWVTSHFSSLAFFGEEVISVEPILQSGSKEIERLRVTSKRLGDQKTIVRTAKHFIVAIGGQARYPEWVSANQSQHNDRIMHSSQYIYNVSRMLPERDAPYSVAVVGGGQSGAEIFQDVVQRYPNSRVSLIIRDSALRPSDDSPFVNEIFNPSSTESFYKLPEERRRAFLKHNSATNYSVVRLELIENLYSILYQQKLPGHTQKHSILSSRQVVSCESDNGRLMLKLGPCDEAGQLLGGPENLTEHAFDAVFVATGYQRNVHSDILKPLAPYILKTDACDLPIDRDYKLRMAPTCHSSIYLQGCCQDTHGISDSLLSVLSIRAAEVTQSLSQNHTKLTIARNVKDADSALVYSSINLNDKNNLNYLWEWVDDFNTRRAPSNQRSGWLRFIDRSIEGKRVTTNGVNHPLRPPSPPPGQLIYSRYIPSIKKTVGFRVVDLQQDLNTFHTWMNNPRVSKFWAEDGTIEEHTTYLKNLHADPHIIPVIGLIDNEPFGYLEIYWGKEDRLGEFYLADDYDRGIHCLVGEQKFRGPEYVHTWMSSINHFAFLSEPRTSRLVGEPRADNDKLIGYAQKEGYKRLGNIQMKHKEAALLMLSRKTFNSNIEAGQSLRGCSAKL